MIKKLKNKLTNVMIHKLKAFVPLALVVLISACTAKGDNPGLEYAPQMYHSVPYEPLTQIVDEDRGEWLSNREDGKGEFYNSNPNNPYAQNVRVPVAGTVRRTSNNILPYRLEKDQLAEASLIENPFPASPEVQAEGRRLYTEYCQHCHGADGKGQGKVGLVYNGVPSYSAPNKKDLPQGHIFHVITHGYNRMWPHGSQISEDRRWKIARYVQQLQQQ